VNILWTRVIPIVLIVGLLTVPTVYFGYQGEWYRWRLAAAQEAVLGENLDQAKSILESIIQQQPEDFTAKAELLEVLAKQGLREACLQKLEDYQNEAPLTVAWLATKASVFHELGMHKEAYQSLVEELELNVKQRNDQPADADQPSNQLRERQIMRINNLAYFSYLANADMEVRYRQINDVLVNHDIEDEFVVYRSEALRLVGRPAEALAIVERSRSRSANALEQREQELKVKITRWMSSRDWPEDEPLWLREERKLLGQKRYMLALLCEQAYEICRDLDDEPGRTKYQSMAKATGVMFARRTEDLSPQTVCGYLLNYGGVIDTRGVLATKLRRWRQAEEDLNAMVQVSRLVDALSSVVQLSNVPQLVDTREINLRQQSIARSKAMYFYHRSLLYQVKRMSVEAELDLSIVREMGFEPSEQLY